MFLTACYYVINSFIPASGAVRINSVVGDTCRFGIAFSVFFFFGYIVIYALSVKKHKHEDQKLDKILIVGGGLSCRLYLSGLFCQDLLANPFDIVGIIDDCKDLSRLNIYGFDVLGSSQDLEQLHTKYAFDKMIVTPGRLQPSTLDNLNRFQKNHPETVILYFHLHLSPVNAVVQHEEKDLLNLNTQKISLFNEEIDNMKNIFLLFYRFHLFLLQDRRTSVSSFRSPLLHHTRRPFPL